MEEDRDTPALLQKIRQMILSKIMSHLYVYSYVESFIVSSMALVKTVNSWGLEMLVKNIIRTHHN